MIRNMIEQYIEEVDVSLDDAAALAAFSDWYRTRVAGAATAKITITMISRRGCVPRVMIEGGSNATPSATGVPASDIAYMLGYGSAGLQLQADRVGAALSGQVADGFSIAFTQGGADAHKSDSTSSFQEATRS